MKGQVMAPEPPPPGSRVRIRGEEWAVEKVLPLPLGGHAVHVQGMSELVRHHQAIFLTPLDPDMVLLAPEDTTLVGDGSPGYRQTALYLETLLRRTPPVHDQIAIGHRGALDVMAYQLVPARQSLGSLRPRILIADGTGLGKTVEVGIILSELIKRGRGRRILVVAIRSMLAQLQRELWARFTLPLVRLDSEGLRRVQAKIPANRNPFSYFDRCIVSMDTLKNSGLYRSWLEQIRWDVIVVDECHNVANRGSQRGALARLLAHQCDALVLTSATPHNGRPESFANLMRMLDPTSVANPRAFTKEDVAHLFVRRFKKDVEHEAAGQLRDREVASLEVTASAEEEAALAALHALDLSTLGRKQSRQDPLVRWSLVKAFLSSPEACLESLAHRIAQTDKALNDDEPHPRAGSLREDRARLGEVEALVAAALARGSGKLARLLAELRGLGVGKKGPRVVIFSERLRTLDMLAEALKTEIGLSEAQIGVFTADTGNDVAQRELVESFGHEDSPLRVLLCSDAASEGVNLHHQCHDLVHYDVPWSLIRLTQRNGRIDRFGQQETPRIRYLVTKSQASTADQQVVDRLIDKEKEVERQLGDPGALLGLYEAESEEAFLTRGIARGERPEALLPDAPLGAGIAEQALGEGSAAGGGDEVPGSDAGEGPAEEEEAGGGGIDLLALFAEVQAEQAATPSLESLVADRTSLFASEYELVVAGLRHLERHPVVGPEPLAWQADDATGAVTIVAPEPFRRHREGFLPREAVPGVGQPYRLVMGRELVATKLRSALDQEGRWPDWHLLWEQHPIVEWLFDALGAAYARGEAPLLRMGTLGPNEAVFLVQAMLFNRESEAVVARWMGFEAADVGSTPRLLEATLELPEVVARVGLRDEMVNPGKPSERQKALQALVPEVVRRAREQVVGDRKAHVKESLLKDARQETRRLEAWAAASLALIDERAAGWTRRGARIPRHLEQRIQQEREEIARVKKNHQSLLTALQAQGEPYLRLAAVFAGA
ncbi:MAG: DEAD/DEAH box helicase [Polyangiaceae bacterium]